MRSPSRSSWYTPGHAAIDPRTAAVRESLRRWLPIVVADERSINATAPMIMAEGMSAEAMADLIPADCIEAALQNESAMCGHVASREQIVEAVRAWELADARKSSVITRPEAFRKRPL